MKAHGRHSAVMVIEQAQRLLLIEPDVSYSIGVQFEIKIFRKDFKSRQRTPLEKIFSEAIRLLVLFVAKNLRRVYTRV